MMLAPSPSQVEFAAVLHEMLSSAGDPWPRLASAGVTALAVPTEWGGLEAEPADLVIAAEELGHHAVPGPVAESLAAVPTLLAGLDEPGRWLPGLANGTVVGTLAAPPWLPYAVDADTADVVLLADNGMVGPAALSAALVAPGSERRLFSVVPAGVARVCPVIGRALDLGVLVCAAQLLGAGRALLEMSVGHARTREQFGGAIGRFQAVQNRLSDVAVGLEFARPLLYAGAVTMTARDVSAAKVACSSAANRAARAALQVHGAIGYTQEFGLGRWLTLVRALSLAWGTPSEHRARVLEGAWN